MKYPIVLFGNYLENLDLILEKNKSILLCTRRNFNTNKIKSFRFTHLKISSKPTKNDIQKYFSQVENIFTEYIVAIGGGSVIDTAKMIKLQFKDRFKELAESIKLIAIPTTFSSAESSKYAVIYSNDYMYKYVISEEFLISDYIIVDKNLSAELNFDLIFFNSIDVLSNLVESYFSEKSAEINIISAISLFFDSIEKTIIEKDSIARENLHICSILSGIAINYSGVSAVHILANFLEEIKNISHGEAISIFLPVFLKFHKEKNTKYQNLTEKLNFDLLEKLNSLYDKFNIYSKIKNFISKQNIDQIYRELKNYRIEESLYVFEILKELEKFLR